MFNGVILPKKVKLRAEVAKLCFAKNYIYFARKFQNFNRNINIHSYYLLIGQLVVHVAGATNVLKAVGIEIAQLPAKFAQRLEAEFKK